MDSERTVDVAEAHAIDSVEIDSLEIIPRQSKNSYQWSGSLTFVLAHLAVFGALWSGVNTQSLVLCFVLFTVRMLFVTAFYHRYFAHRTYKTSRVLQFIFAFLAQSSSQKGVLWWASHHRVHHKKSDRPGDVHSPVIDSVFYAHLGWLFADTAVTHWHKIRDFANYPELVWLNRYWALQPVLLAIGCLLWMGWPGLFVGFFGSQVLLWHGTFLVNSLSHVVGEKRFCNGDESRNNWLIALITHGEGWHNNHHHYQSSCRNGFYWWEIDVTYYFIRLMGALGLVWDIREPPSHVIEEGRRLDRLAAEARR
ncbi:MAG: acyl-CoA desaturase [Myxococcota bacterium]